MARNAQTFDAAANASRSRRVPVSVIVPVKNEAANLPRCLASLQWADELFVVDSQSTDATAEIAADYGARVVQFYFNGTYPKKKNWALENLPLRNEWVLIVDADEVIGPELADRIERAVRSGEADGYYLHFRYMFLGRPIRHCGYGGTWVLRLFRHRLGRYEKMPVRPGSNTGDNEAHEHVLLEGRTQRLTPSVEHYAYPSIDAWVAKHNRYSNWEAELFEDFRGGRFEAGGGRLSRVCRLKRRLKRIYLRLPLRFVVRFLYAYLLRLGFLDGRAGFTLCVLLSFYDFLSSAKVYENRLRDRARAAGPDAVPRRAKAA